MSSLNIVICSPLYINGGGCETWLDYFLEGIKKEGRYACVNVYHIAPHENKKTIKDRYVNDTFYRFFYVNVGSQKRGSGFKNIIVFTLFTVKRFMKSLKRGDHIILIGSTYAGAVGIISRALFGKKVSILTWIRSMAIGELSSRKSKFVKFGAYIEKKIIRKTDMVITNGLDTLQNYKSHYPKFESKMYVIENAVHFHKFSSIQTVNLRRKISVAYMGRLTTAKGFPQYIDSIQTMGSADRSSIEFNVYGHGEKENLIDKNMLTYHGPFFPDDVVRIFEKNEVVVFLNNSKSAGGLSHGILEAMAAGRLIVAWENPVHCQILNNNNAVLIPEGDIHQLAVLFEKMASPPESFLTELEKKSMNARRDASFYSVESHVNKYSKLIERVAIL